MASGTAEDSALVAHSGGRLAGNIGQLKVARRTLGISLTDACPVGCSHCIVSSLPTGADQDLDSLSRWLGSASSPLPIGAVGFTGGEPFCRYALLEKAVLLAHGLGLATGVVTSAFWAVDDRQAAYRLERLRVSGLSGVAISMDEEHARKIPTDRPRRAIRIAAGLGLNVTLSARFPAGLASTEISSYLREMVGPELELVTDVVQGEIQPLGRAKGISAPPDASHRRRLCPASMLMVGVNGTIKCCCSIELGQESPLVLGHIDELPLESAYSQWRNSSLMLALVAGGVDLLWGWCETAGLVPTLIGRFGAHDVCGACHELLSVPARATYIRERAVEPATRRSLALRHFLVTGDSWALLHGDQLS